MKSSPASFLNDNCRSGSGFGTSRRWRYIGQVSVLSGSAGSSATSKRRATQFLPDAQNPALVGIAEVLGCLSERGGLERSGVLVGPAAAS